MTQPGLNLPFFAYGTLLPGQRNYDVWREAIRSTRPAFARDCLLYDLGGYPLLVRSAGGEVRGLLVTLRRDRFGQIVTVLDQLEGVDNAASHPHYRRERLIVQGADGHPAVAWVYAGRRALVAGLEPIGRDWKAFTHANQRRLEARTRQ